MLRELDRDIWIEERPQGFYGLEVGTRMTVMRLADGSLVLHSPVSLDAALRAELDALGRVGYAVAPNRFHHLYAGEVTRAYPEAQLWAAPGVAEKRPDLAIDGVLADAGPEAWQGQVEHVFFRGRPFENEIIFLHRPSRTLIVCDLVFNFGPGTHFATRLLLQLIRSYGRFGPSRLDPLLVRDRKAARASLEQILEWDFDRVVVGHGDVLASGGHEALRAGYAWLLSS